ncbi:tetratricopeptide repeat protein, partial [bacterium]|nr:tetratricopeptide repeat protein [bacterium]
LEMDPELLETYEFLAVLFESNKDFLNMKLALEKVIELNPNNYDARFNMAVILLNEELDLKAAEVYEKLAEDIGVNEEIAMRLGLIYSANSQYDRALKWLFDYTRLKPDNADVYLEIAKIYAIRQDTVKIEPMFAEALQKNPGLDKVRTELSQIYLHQNRVKDAISLYQTAALGDSVSVLNQLKLANLMLQDGDSTKSWHIFNQLLTEYPDDWRVQYTVGGVYHSLGKTAAAQEHLEKALLLKTDLPSIREELAAVYRSEKAYDKALDLFIPVAKADSTDMAARFYIGDILVEKGDTTSALIFYEQEWEEHPDEWRFPYSIGQIHYAQDDHLQAQKYLMASFALNDAFSNTYLLLGISYMQTRQYEKAAQIFILGTQKFTDIPDMYYFLGSSRQQQNRHALAIPALIKAIELDPENARAMWTVAASYDEVRNFTASEKYYEKALKLRPNDPLILNNYSYSLSTRSIRLNQALDMVSRAVQLEPENGAYLDTIGWVYYQLGEFEKALQYIQEALFHQGESAEVYDHLGCVYQELDELERAHLCFQKAIALEPTRDGLREKLDKTKP